MLIALAAALKGGNPPTPSIHRLRHGLPGVSNPVRYPCFRTSASVTDQRAAFATGVLPYIYAFHTATHGVPLSSSALKSSSFQCTSPG